MFIVLPADPRHIPNLHVLWALQTNVQSRPGRSGGGDSNSKYRGRSRDGSPRGLFRHLRAARRRILHLQFECDSFSGDCHSRPRSVEPDLGSIDVQGCSRLPISSVRSYLPSPSGRFNWLLQYRILAVILAFFCFVILATFPGWHDELDPSGSEIEARPIPSRPVSQAALALTFVASVFVLVSVLWQHTASVAASTIVQDLGNGSVKSGVGTSAMVLGWFGFGLLVVVTIGLLVMILSVKLIQQLTD